MASLSFCIPLCPHVGHVYMPLSLYSSLYNLHSVFLNLCRFVSYYLPLSLRYFVSVPARFSLTSVLPGEYLQFNQPLSPLGNVKRRLSTKRRQEINSGVVQSASTNQKSCRQGALSSCRAGIISVQAWGLRAGHFNRIHWGASDDLDARRCKLKQRRHLWTAAALLHEKQIIMWFLAVSCRQRHHRLIIVVVVVLFRREGCNTVNRFRIEGQSCIEKRQMR